MLEQISAYRRSNRQKLLLILGISILGLFCLAALMHIGTGDAEWGGMTVSNVTPTTAMEFNIPKEEKGVVVNWCEDPAYSSGLRSGDLLKGMNNKKINNINDFLKAAKGISIGQGGLLDVMRNGQPLYITLENKVGMHDAVKNAFNFGELNAPSLSSPGQSIAFTGQAPATGNNTGAGDFIGIAPDASALPSPKEQMAALKELVEGHWLGMEVIPLMPELAKEFNITPGTKGVLVDEISLESAESGVLAGDMVIAVDDFATPDLTAFTEATRKVKNEKKSRILVSRRGRILEFTMSCVRTLGFSQNEAAQPIKPGAISPHRSRGRACTECHIIMVTGGQLPTDAGDIVATVPPIIKGAVCPHENRGKCQMCHVVLKDVMQ